MLPTAVAASNLGVTTLLITILGFVAIYTVLFLIEMKLMLKAIRKGPELEPEQQEPQPLSYASVATAQPTYSGK